MLRRIVNVVMVSILVLTAFTALVSAQTSGPTSPMLPPDDFIKLEPGTMHWYAFNFDYDEDLNVPIEIKLYAEPYESAVLTVMNQDQVDLWMRDGEKTHFGCCSTVTQDKDHDGKGDYLMWAGLPEASGTYYIRVEVAEGLTEPAFYKFSMTGKNFTMMGEQTVPALATVAEAPASITVPEKAPLAVTGLNGSSPFFAMVPVGDWVEIQPGVQHWYAFNFDYDEDYTQPAEIRLFADRIDDVTLTIHNGEQARQWELGEVLKHFGCCTGVDEDKDDNGTADYAMWAGGLRSSGRYYIVVEAPADAGSPAMYRFDLAGEGISY